MSDEVERTADVIRAGGLAIVPTDTVYGLACTPYREESVRRLYELKGRAAAQPTAIVGASVDLLLECVPELRGRAGTLARALLPGPFTLVLPNPAGRFPWLCGGRPEAIGVRVPELTGQARALFDRVDALAATSANHAGAPDSRRLADVPPELLAGVGVALDAGELPGVPSTVLDLTAAEPRVLREGAIRAAEALERLSAVI